MAKTGRFYSKKTRIDEIVPDGPQKWRGCQTTRNGPLFLGKFEKYRNMHFQALIQAGRWNFSDFGLKNEYSPL